MTKKIEFTYADKLEVLQKIESDLSDHPVGYPITWAINDCAKKVGMTMGAFDRAIKKIEIK